MWEDINIFSLLELISVFAIAFIIVAIESVSDGRDVVLLETQKTSAFNASETCNIGSISHKFPPTFNGRYYMAIQYKNYNFQIETSSYAYKRHNVGDIVPLIIIDDCPVAIK